MKNTLFALLFVSLLFVGLDAKSQNMDLLPLIHQRILQAKLREIKLSLKLDQATFDQFSPIYIRYDHEVSLIDFSKLTRLMKIEPDSLSDKEANNLIIIQLHNARRLINIREKYYKEFSAVLKPQQIIKLYQTEAELRKKVLNELKRRMMNR